MRQHRATSPDCHPSALGRGERRRGCLQMLLCLSLLLVAPAAEATGFYIINSVGLAQELTAITMSHHNPNYVIVGTAEGKIMITEDGGATWQEFNVTQPRSLFYGRERQPDPAWQYAPGLPGKSPHLQSWLRRKGLHTAGTNLSEFLFTQGEKPVTINWIEIDWHDEKRIFVATPSGLFRSLDKGRTFIRIFSGYNGKSERMVTAVATDPNDPKKVIMGTAAGIWVSKNNGISFLRTLNFYLRDSYVREIWFDPEQPGLVHLALGGSAMASPDAGKNWITTHWCQWAPRANVNSVSIGPGNLRLMGTNDGVYASFQGGEWGTWKRRGFRFPHMRIHKVLASRDPKVWLAMTDQALWSTEDMGINWKKIYLTGGKEIPRWFATFRQDLKHLWFITNREIYRRGPPPGMRRTNLSMRGSKRLLQVPDLFTLVRRILRHHHAYFAQNQKVRDRAPWAALLPSITAGYRYSTARDVSDIRTAQFFWEPYTYFNASSDYGQNWEVLAKWDLGRLIFDKASLPSWGRIERHLSGLRQEITDRVHRLYVEYKRVARILVYAPPADELTRQFHEIRLRELSALLNGMSDGYWEEVTGGLQ